MTKKKKKTNSNIGPKVQPTSNLEPINSKSKTILGTQGHVGFLADISYLRFEISVIKSQLGNPRALMLQELYLSSYSDLEG